MSIYVRLPGNGWIKIKEKVARPRALKRSSRSSQRIVLAYSMVGESVEAPPALGNKADEFYISAFKVSKYIMKILDVIKDECTILVEPVTRETYVVKAYECSPGTVDELKRMALETKALKVRPSKALEKSEEPSS